MPPNLIPCKFCSRLYSVHSLKFHKCSENPDNARPISAGVRRRNTTSAREKNEPKNGIRRSRSVGSSHSKRPETHTIDSHRGGTAQKAEERRPCFVCGKFVKPERLTTHSSRCEAEWMKTKSEMPRFISLTPPISVKIPSIDGTVDNARVDQLALKSAQKAQTAVCNRCKTVLTLENAITHRCSKHEPTVEFFF